MRLIIHSDSVFKTDYDNYALVGSCYNIDESTHKEILYVLVRSKACWADRNKGNALTSTFTVHKLQTITYSITVIHYSEISFIIFQIEFINEQLNFLEEIGLYTGNMRDVSQDKCEGDGIDRNLCDDYEYDMSASLAAKTALLLLAFSCFL